MSKEFGSYYLGFDISNDSVGWAVTDTNYNILKFNGKSMWGVRMFDEAQTGEERRLYRASRKHFDRRRKRIELLQEIFAEEVFKVDPTFFLRLNCSNLLPSDKSDGLTNSKKLFFEDPNFTDQDYYDKYPTIYHLRHDLMVMENSPDIRLLYLALHHIIKYRGHFHTDIDIKQTNIDTLIYEFKESVRVNLDIKKFNFDKDEFKKKLNDNLSNKNRKESLLKLYNDKKNNKKWEALVKLLNGEEVDISSLLKSNKEIKINFSNENYDKIILKIYEKLGDDILHLLNTAKAIYDWSLHVRYVKGKTYISEVKIDNYAKHHDDLKRLKKYIKEYASIYYGELFSPKNGLYAAYAGHKNKHDRLKKNGENSFYSRIKEILRNSQKNDEQHYILDQIERELFLPLQTSVENSIVPYTFHSAELKRILNNMVKHFEFLRTKDSTGVTAKEKIMKLLKFRIPVYVGSLNDHNKDGIQRWVVRKEGGKVTPWNFNEKIDEFASADNYVKKSTNKCSYLFGKDVLPKSSLLYSEFMVLNELNGIKENDKKLSPTLKLDIYKKLFCKKVIVTKDDVARYLAKNYGKGIKEIVITGVGDVFKSSLISYHDFKDKVFKNNISVFKNQTIVNAVEKVIVYITLFSDNKEFLKRKITSEFSDIFSSDQIKAMCNLKYIGWGRLSKELLTDITEVNSKFGKSINIIESLKATDNDLNQLLSPSHKFSEEIEKYNSEYFRESLEEISYKTVLEDKPMSSAVKRSIWQTILIAEEIKKVTKSEPYKIFIKMHRGNLTKSSKNPQTRKDMLTELYANIKEDKYSYLKDELKKTTNEELQKDKIYLYFTQLGRCMYTREKIDFNNLLNNNDYDIDHIYPQSKVKDDSLNNIVLVNKVKNSQKKNEMISHEIQSNMKNFWEILQKKYRMISKDKLKRLLRQDDFTKDELLGFINRRLVEVRQSTKFVADIFKSLYKNSELVYVKAMNIDDFRERNCYTKVTSVNDLYHAKDAYLSIIVGNVYNAQFTNNPYLWINQSNTTPDYNISDMYGSDSPRAGVWTAGNDGTIKTVEKNIFKNDVLYTRRAISYKGSMFSKQLISYNNTKQPPTVPMKKNIDLGYGGYNNETVAYYSIVSSVNLNDGEKMLTVEGMPCHLREIHENEECKYFCEKYNLVDPEIKINFIRRNIIFKVNGFPLYFNGSEGNELKFFPAVQLCLNEDNMNYIKLVELHLENKKENDDKKKFKNKSQKSIEPMKGNLFGGLAVLKSKQSQGNNNEISGENNLKLYSDLISKFNKGIYENYPNSNLKKLLKNNVETFRNLSVNDQCKLLLEILKLFTCNDGKADLSLLKEGKEVGDILLNKDITKLRSVIALINQSPTGLFEEYIKL